jgi:hypothetical protein
MTMAQWYKKLAILIMILLVALVAGRKALYWLGVWKRPVTKEVIGRISPYPFPRTGVSYNFNRMIDLIDASREIKTAFYAQFTDKSSRKQIEKQIDVEALKELLAELYRERVRLRTFLQDLKGSVKEPLTVKNRRAILYYLKVLCKCIDDLEAIIRKV